MGCTNLHSNKVGFIVCLLRVWIVLIIFAHINSDCKSLTGLGTIIIILILSIRRWGTEIKELVQGHSTSKQQSWDLIFNSGLHTLPSQYQLLCPPQQLLLPKFVIFENMVFVKLYLILHFAS